MNTKEIDRLRNEIAIAISDVERTQKLLWDAANVQKETLSRLNKILRNAQPEPEPEIHPLEDERIVTTLCQDGWVARRLGDNWGISVEVADGIFYVFEKGDSREISCSISGPGLRRPHYLYACRFAPEPDRFRGVCEWMILQFPEYLLTLFQQVLDARFDVDPPVVGMTMKPALALSNPGAENGVRFCQSILNLPISRAAALEGMKSLYPEFQYSEYSEDIKI